MTSIVSFDQDSDTQKYIAFPVADRSLALPLRSVLRVLRHEPDNHDEALNTLGLLQIGRHTIRVLNLHQWLTPTFAPQDAAPAPFLIVARSAEWEPFGVWADGLPDLVELPPDMLRSLPSSARAASGFLDLISHTAVIPQTDGSSQTLLLLDIPKVLKARAPEMAALPSQV
ncbi:MAG: chemotaxis protein CheW [Cyanobacteria bacterium J06559_3]